MSQAAWEDVVELPEVFDDNTAEEILDSAVEGQDMTEEVSPHPQVETKKANQGLESGEWFVQEAGHVPNTENVPKADGDLADATVWKSGNGRYRIFLHRR